MNGLNIQSPEMPFFTKEQIILLKKTLLGQFSPEEQELFIVRCERDRLDPFSGQIHPTKRKTKIWEKGKEVYIDKLVTVIGIYGLIARAVRTGQYDGCEVFWCGPGGTWKEEWLEEENPAAAKAVIHVKNRSRPEIAIARWFSFAQEIKTDKGYELSKFWRTMPDYMLSKCARAAALRGAFPDQLSGLFLKEELGSQPELEIISGDEEKIASTQERERQVKIPGAKMVESKGERPTPAEALAPAFPEDEEGAIPRPTRSEMFGEKVARDYPQEAKTFTREEAAKQEAKQVAAAQKQEKPTQPDDLNMGPYPEAPQSSVNTLSEPGKPAEPAPAAEPPAWKAYVLKGITHPRFHLKTLGELDEGDRAILENQWIPAIRDQWEKANAAQKADYPFVESCIAYYKMAKPWD